QSQDLIERSGSHEPRTPDPSDGWTARPGVVVLGPGREPRGTLPGHAAGGDARGRGDPLPDDSGGRRRPPPGGRGRRPAGRNLRGEPPDPRHPRRRAPAPRGHGNTPEVELPTG